MLWTEFHEDTVTFKTITLVSDLDGSPLLNASSGTSLACKVDGKSVNRVTDQGSLLSATAYTIYFATEPTDTAANRRLSNPLCRVDDVFVWGSKTLVATGPAVSISALGDTQYKVECVERV